jgi:endonuclease YncB( thermonuclease family)
MKLTTIFILVLFGSNCLAELNEAQKPAENCKHDQSTFRCVKYIKNYDADTITVEIPEVHPLLGHQISVRVNGIDTAEMKGKAPCEKDRAVAAQQIVAKMLTGAKRINLHNVQRDKYFRVLADVEVDGQFIKDLLFKERLAYEYHGKNKKMIDWCSMGPKRVPASKENK